MSMKESVISVFKNWNNFKGRACRSEFWYFVLASALLGLVVGIIEVTTGMVDIEKGGSIEYRQTMDDTLFIIFRSNQPGFSIPN